MAGVKLEVKPGSIWRDADPRYDRRVRVDRVDETHATVVTIWKDGRPAELRPTRVMLTSFGKSRGFLPWPE